MAMMRGDQDQQERDDNDLAMLYCCQKPKNYLAKLPDHWRGFMRLPPRSLDFKLSGRVHGRVYVYVCVCIQFSA